MNESPEIGDLPTVIEVENLVTHYGTRKILNSVSW
jgi:ABC-type molybdenum transport system ATPase subunit/photorepair protein PhrA